MSLVEQTIVKEIVPCFTILSMNTCLGLVRDIRVTFQILVRFLFETSKALVYQTCIKVRQSPNIIIKQNSSAFQISLSRGITVRSFFDYV